MFRATITAACRNRDGSGTLTLGAWPGRAGTVVLYVDNPPAKGFDACVGVEVLIGRAFLMVGGLKWAERMTNTRVRLLPAPGGGPK